jgi:hypothetical protein
MDADRFDILARSLSTAGSRRRALAAILGGSLGLLGWYGAEEVDAHNPLRSCKKKSGRAKKKCLKKARAHNATHTVQAPAPGCTPSCAATNPCGSDGCNGSCGSCSGGSCRDGVCACPDGEEPCRDECVETCRAGEDRDPRDCTCCLPEFTACDDVTGFPPCCSGICDPDSNSPFGGFCVLIPAGEPCDFSAQCATGHCSQEGLCTFRTCQPGDNACVDQGLPCGKECECFPTLDGQTRCGHLGTFAFCTPCTSDADCQDAPHNVADAFCAQIGGFCCGASERPGFCMAPCPG